MKSLSALDVAVGVFVAILFGGFAAMFIGELVILVTASKFSAEQVNTIASFSSQQFVFFPTAGVLMLICFAPMTVSQIAHRMRQGARGVITVILFLALIFVGGAGLGYVLDGGGEAKNKNPIVWEISPDAVSAIPGCTVQSVFDAHQRFAAHPGGGESQAPNASAANASEPKFCAAAATGMATADACRIEQAKLNACVKDLWQNKPSEVSKFHRLALTADAIFLLGMLILGLRLAGRPTSDHSGAAGAPERLLLCGALLLALWPLLNTNYVASAAAIYGDGVSSSYRRMSPLFNVAYVAWAISVISYLQGRFNTQSEGVWRIVTVAGTALGALQFDTIIKLFRQYLGPGADTYEMAAFIILYMTLSYQIAGLMLGSGEQKRAAEAAAS